MVTRSHACKKHKTYNKEAGKARQVSPAPVRPAPAKRSPFHAHFLMKAHARKRTLLAHRSALAHIEATSRGKNSVHLSCDLQLLHDSKFAVHLHCPVGTMA